MRLIFDGLESKSSNFAALRENDDEDEEKVAERALRVGTYV